MYTGIPKEFYVNSNSESSKDLYMILRGPDVLGVWSVSFSKHILRQIGTDVSNWAP
jgi:hypothetical protein